MTSRQMGITAFLVTAAISAFVVKIAIWAPPTMTLTQRWVLGGLAIVLLTMGFLLRKGPHGGGASGDDPRWTGAWPKPEEPPGDPRWTGKWPK